MIPFAFAVGALLLIAAAVVVFRREKRLETSAPDSSATKPPPGLTPGWIRLSFDLSCAVRAGDAAPFYAALRRRDRSALSDIIAQKKIITVHKNTALSVVPVEKIAKVYFGDPGRLQVCYIPSDVVTTIERNAYR